ncbi:periplasmic substrate-binding domain-containing protein [Nakamurella leprariae]|uniref:Solute-binding protein family 5 domain-containing protein n=1 Tax=Nakamurella leprariae TaxID=2803911 RepID=A0A938Y6L8_9ACTN|nr:hypothetical protein [Nakamurella leprariae]MBM9466996.1 hypothetical protein [Nakamurella leprariae]
MAGEAGFRVESDLHHPAMYYDAAWLEIPLGLTGWASRPTASQFLSLFTSDAVWNTGRWTNREFDALVEQYESTVDEAERTDVANQLATLVRDEVPQIIASWPQVAIAMTNSVHGMPADASSYVELSGAWKE